MAIRGHSTSPKGTPFEQLIRRLAIVLVLLASFTGPLPDWQTLALDAVVALAGLLAIERPLLGLLASAILTAVGTYTGAPTIGVLVYFIASTSTYYRRPLVLAVPSSVAVGLYLVAIDGRWHPATIAITLLFPAALGLTTRLLTGRGRRARQTIAERTAAIAAIRADERHLLAVELSRLIGETVERTSESLRSLDLVSDTGTIQRGLSAIQADARAALARLRALVLTLRGAEKARTATLADGMDDFEDELTNHSFWVEREVLGDLSTLPEQADGLAAAALAAAADVVRVEGVPGSSCGLTVIVDDARLQMTLVCHVVGGTSPSSAALRGIQAQAEALGGTATTVSEGPQWSMRLTLPLAPLVGSTSVTPQPPAPAVLASWRGIPTSALRWTARSVVAISIAVVLNLSLRGAEHNTVGWLLGLAYLLSSVAVARWGRYGVLVSLALAALVVPGGRHLETLGNMISLAAVSLVLACMTGLTMRHFLASRRAHLRQLAMLDQAKATARMEEHLRLAGELHDIIAHQLSSIALEIGAHESSQDPLELQQTLHRVSTIIESTHHDLATLVALMDTSAETSVEARSADTSRWSTPTATARAAAQTLRSAGFTVNTTVDADADRCDPTVARAASRVLREATTNAIRYAPAGTAITISVDSEADEIRVAVTNETADTAVQNPDSTGLGLLGLTECVDLVGGVFRAGESLGTWRVTAKMPRDLPGVEPSVAPTDVPALLQH